MQHFKPRFLFPDGGRLSNLQSCIRTNDLDLVGDGTHLTSFGMLGNFSFGNHDYPQSVELWDTIIRSLGITVSSVHIHPSQNGHRGLWESLGHTIVNDPSCEWSDGKIGGYCSELYVGDLEIGNLVNTLGASTDVGFGIERLLQVVEGKSSIHDTSLFRTDVVPVVNDHLRTLELLYLDGVQPGNKGRNYVCRRLLRRVLRYEYPPDLMIDSWLIAEREQRDRRLREGKRLLKRHFGKDDRWWWESVGILPEERAML